MDADTKKLIEKYKLELMAAASTRGTAAPEPALIAWSPEADDEYAEDTAVDEYPRSTTEQSDDFTSLPPQFTDEAPQFDFEDDNVTDENNQITDQTEPQPEPLFRREGENTASDPQQTDSLGTIPESGQSPDEQLGRRSFESSTTPVNSPDDIKPLVQEENGDYPKTPAEPEYADIDDFLRANPEQGSLRFRTYTARGALPVEGAHITVSKTIGGNRRIFYDITTDSSGQSEILPLPAPSKELSQTPTVSVQPYSLYDAEIIADGYIPVSIRSLPVFEGILSVQRAALVPSAGLSDTETITEAEPNLTEVTHG